MSHREHEITERIGTTLLGRYYVPGSLVPLWVLVPGLLAGIYFREPIWVVACVVSLAYIGVDIYRKEQRWRS